MTYEAQREIQKALRSLPWYMFLVPTLVTLFLSLFDSPGPHSIWSDTRPEYGYWALMWIVAKLGFFVWILRQLLRLRNLPVQPTDIANGGAVQSHVVALLRTTA